MLKDSLHMYSDKQEPYYKYKPIFPNKKAICKQVALVLIVYGGGGGIRTPASREAPVGFQDRSLQPDLGTPPCRTGSNVITYKGTGQVA